MEMTKAQVEAVTSKSNYILVIAGAGSGKTAVLTTRIANLIKTKKCTGKNILCVTFTRNAGKEMQERISNLIGSECSSIFCNTFHAFCIDVLRKWGYKIGCFEDFSIFSQKQKLNLMKEILLDLCIVKKVDAIKDTDLKNFSLCIAHPEYKKIDYPELSKYILAASEYKFRLRKDASIDLDMILTESLRLLQDPEVSQYYRNLYKYCFIDEAQDTSDTQMSIIDAISPQNLFVSGDIDQSIYQWRSANPKNMLNFPQKYPNAQVIKLEDNFRSTYPIVNAANNLIKNNKSRFDKTLIAHKKGERVDFITAENLMDEAKKIAQIIKSSNKDYNNFAVLARNNSLLKNIAKQFKVFDIPYNFLSKEDILNKPDIELIFNFVEGCINPSNDSIVKRTINFPNTILNKDQIRKIELKCLEDDISFFDGLNNFKFKEQSKVNSQLGYMKNIAEFARSNNNALDVLQYTVKCLNLNNMPNLNSAYQKIKKWCETQKKFFNGNCSIEYFLKWLKTRENAIGDISKKEDNLVQLMTVHASKGLEFSDIFIVGMSQGIFPNKRSSIEAERNLMYVALTRAKQKCYLTRSINVIFKNGLQVKTKPSIFLYEIFK